jgi:ABC-type uncharacterized transport system substrate-binding protein
MLGALFLAGCVFAPPAPPVETAPPVEPVVAEPEPAPPPPAPVEPRPVPPRPVPRTAVLVSDDIPDYMRIAEEIRKRDADHVTIHNLDGQPNNAQSMLAEIESASSDRVVAIGLLAATVGRRAGVPMVFCQVYNYQDYDLVSPTSKGVQLLPPFSLQLDAWKSLSPELDSIGIVSGPGQEALLDEIRQVVERAGLALTVATVESDQEALLAFKDMTHAIDGLWLLPDNRILSPDVVREMMSYSAKHRKQVVVFGKGLLGLGALMSVTSDERDVADRVLARFSEVSNGRVLGPDMEQLTKIHTDVNLEVARYLELAVPEQIIGAR